MLEVRHRFLTFDIGTDCRYGVLFTEVMLDHLSFVLNLLSANSWTYRRDWSSFTG